MAAGNRPADAPPPPPPSSPSPASVFRDISNFKTPRPNLYPPKTHDASPVFFTASNNTPFSVAASSRGRRPSVAAAKALPRSLYSKVGRRLRAFEAEQCQSSRKAQIRRDRSLGCLERSMSAWINFLFESPAACGCERPGGSGKGESLDGAWRSTKGVPLQLKAEKPVRRDGEFLALRASLEEVCSLEDLMERMGAYIDSEHQKEVLNCMIQVAKNIDDGRLRMKQHCPIATDVRLKDKAIKTLLSYNLTWLKIGLHMVFGGDSLLPAEFSRAGHDELFLKMVVDKQMFFHRGLAKSYAYNKKVEGLYRPGYFEALGNLILKRFLLLVLLLDKVKSLTALPLDHGIDGADGGSPLLFDCKSPIKSSRHLIKEFLSEAMHGEGDLIAHLVALGYKVNHEQVPIVEYNFNISNLLEDVRDGVRLCRVVQLLKCDASVLSNLAVPSDSCKKCLMNCNIALMHLKEIGVPLCDEDGVSIVADDLVNRDRELTLSLLWNIFVHLQVPLLINQNLIAVEILKVKSCTTGTYDFSMLNHMDMLLEWTKAICGQYHFHLNEFASLKNGKALSYLVDYYTESCPSDVFFLQNSEVSGETFTVSDSGDVNAMRVFTFIEQITNTLGEMQQTCDVLGDDVGSNEKSVIILLVFLASHLTGRKKLDQQNLRRILQWKNLREESFASNKQQRTLVNNRHQEGKAALKVQSHFRGWVERRRYLNMKRAALYLQSVIRAWLTSSNPVFYSFGPSLSQGKLISNDTFIKYAKYFNERHRYLVMKTSMVLIQSYARGCIARSLFAKMITIHKKQLADKLRTEAVITIQSYTRRWSAVKNYKELKNAVINIQRKFRCLMCLKAFKELKFAAVEIQRLARGQVVRNRMLGTSSFHLREYRSTYHGNDFELQVVMSSILKLQRWWRDIFLQKRIRAAIIVQSRYRRWIACKKVRQMRMWVVCKQQRKRSAVIVQSQFRRWIACAKVRQLRMWVLRIQSHWRGWQSRRDFRQLRHASVVIQKWIRGRIARKQLLGVIRKQIVDGDKRQGRVICNFNESATIIQSYFRGWIARREVSKRRRCIVVIQKFWKGCIARKMSRDVLFDLRARMLKSAANVSNSPRLMERLVAALTELQSMKKVSSILQTCATLDMATENSQKCCETLVEAGAMNKILQLIRTFNQSTPQLEVSKHLLSILRNLARYPHLARALVNTNGSIDVIFFEALRNKGEGYFIAVGILKKLCAMQEGSNAIQRLPFFTKRLTSFVEELARKSTVDKSLLGLYKNKNTRITVNAKEDRARRLREATELLRIVTSECSRFT